MSLSIAPFLASVGEPVVLLIREVFQGDDDIWKYWCIERVVGAFPKDVAAQLLLPDLQRIAFHPSVGEKSEEVDEQARTALEGLNEG